MKTEGDRGGRGRIVGLPMLVIGVGDRLVQEGGKWFVAPGLSEVSRCCWGWARVGGVGVNREGRRSEIEWRVQ